MKLQNIFHLTALLIGAGATNASLYRRDHDVHDYFAVHLHSSVSPDQAARLLGARHEGQIGELEGHHTFSLPRERSGDLNKILDDLQSRARRRRSLEARGEYFERDGLDGVLWSEKLKLKKRLHKRVPPPMPRGPVAVNGRSPDQAPDPAASTRQNEIAGTLGIRDPSFKQQWHLFNPIHPGNDLNVTGLWLEGITGKGTISAIVDDGLDMYSNDLKDNYFAKGSYDFNEMQPEPRPLLDDDKHGTRCAGEVAAVHNDVCGVGVAYDGKVAGIRILSKSISDEDEAVAVNYGFQENQIYSCSWGPIDDGRTMDTPGLLVRRAIANGIQKGRGGKGSVFVFAAGNGAHHEDNCNFDGYTNSIFSITVGAVDWNNDHPYYSESCSAQLVVAYSSGGGGSIHTSDVGANTCSSQHGGTSAAGPLVVGVMALVLQVRPELSWRDLQYLLVETAVPINATAPGWQTTSIGKKFSHDFGYGKVDAYSTVQFAKEWKPVKPQAWFHSPWLKVYHDIPQGDKGLSSSFEIKDEMLKEHNLERVEHVTVTMNVNHTRRGDLSVELRSPSGVISYLSTTRSQDDERAGYADWTFMSVAHWGENGLGKWTVIVKDTQVNEYNGTFVDWRLTLWGESIDGSIQKLHPLPDVHDHDHDTSIPAPHVDTTSVSPGPTKTSPPFRPTDNVDRPTKPKPSGSTTPDPAGTAASAPSSAPSSGAEHFLPSPFPTFGVSKHTQIWIYGSIGLILVFCTALGAYFWVQRRKRLRNNPLNEYEFEMVAEDEEGFPLSGAGAGGKKHTRRGGELYDAFAGGSDDEDPLFSSGEDDSHEYVDGDEDDDSYHDDGPEATTPVSPARP
ncbi:kexin [Arthroderma uncinatum]|uniref:kexin n=1 Tax=Arthroderma uncinatum TaxID=74035 RepID=UPI00144A543C|nr:kexin [Arthroderma uncinatum]KAF3491813.1 kexin [Arthroderma uncinatum]